MTDIDIRPSALLALAVLWYLDGSGLMSALLPAVVVHELGHWAAVALTGGRITALRLTLFGACMECSPAPFPLQSFLRSLAGPVAGAVFAAVASWAGVRLCSEYLLCSAGVSAALTAFNLLPHPALDGGAALTVLLGGGETAERVTALLGLLTASGITAAGVWFYMDGLGLAPFAVGLGLLLLSVKSTCAGTSHGVL